HRHVRMHVRDLTAEDFVTYCTMASFALGSGSDPTYPDAPRGISPGQTALSLDSSFQPAGQDGNCDTGARIDHVRAALGSGGADCGHRPLRSRGDGAVDALSLDPGDLSAVRLPGGRPRPVADRPARGSAADPGGPGPPPGAGHRGDDASAAPAAP